MAFDSGFLDKRAKVARPSFVRGEFGRNSRRTEWEPIGTIWVNLKYTKGMNALTAGMIEAYDVVMIRCRFYPFITRDCRMTISGKTYEIDTLNADREANTIQITAHEVRE